MRACGGQAGPVSCEFGSANQLSLAQTEDLRWLRNGSEDPGDGREDRPRMHVFAVSTDPETTLAS